MLYNVLEYVADVIVLVLTNIRVGRQKLLVFGSNLGCKVIRFLLDFFGVFIDPFLAILFLNDGPEDVLVLLQVLAGPFA